MALLFFAACFIIAGIVILVKGINGKYQPFGAIGILAGIAMIMFSMVVVIDEGEIGVVLIFGKAEKQVLSPGINFVPPYADIFKYSSRNDTYTQDGEEMIEARVNNGLIIYVDCSTIYRIDPTMATIIYSTYATNLEVLRDKVLVPTLRTIIRNVISKYNSEEVYSSKREVVAIEIIDTLRLALADKGLLIDEFLIRAITLPKEVDSAIQAKIAAQQEAEAMQYKKQKAEQEAEIKIIEAEGLAQAQRIINSTLSPNYLQHEAIQAYKELAASPNTTFVIMPTSPTSTGIPLILGGN